MPCGLSLPRRPAAAARSPRGRFQHWSKRGWAERALQRLQEQLETLRVELNREKTKMVDTSKGEAFGFLGFDLRRVHKRKKDGYTIQMTPKKKARKVVKAKIRDIIRSGGATPVAVIVARVNAVVAGWVNYFRVGNSSRAFSEVRDYRGPARERNRVLYSSMYPAGRSSERMHRKTLLPRLHCQEF